MSFFIQYNNNDIPNIDSPVRTSFEDIDSELVILCHCPPPIHDQLYYVRDGEPPVPVGDTVTYVDPKNTDERHKQTLNEISNNSKSYIWLYNCPIYPIFSIFGVDVFFDRFRIIIEQGYKILKENGKIIIPFIPGQHIHLEQVRSIIEGKFTIEDIDRNNFEFNIKKERELFDDLKTSMLYVFTKITSSHESQEETDTTSNLIPVFVNRRTTSKGGKKKYKTKKHKKYIKHTYKRKSKIIR